MTKGSEDRAAEVLRLAYVDGLGVRTIARRLSMSRKTVRRLLGCDRPKAKPRPSPEPRSSVLDAFTPVIRDLLHETPEMKAPAVLERLRPLGYTGGISILRDRVRKLRPGGHREAFLTLDFAPGKGGPTSGSRSRLPAPGGRVRDGALLLALPVTGVHAEPVDGLVPALPAARDRVLRRDHRRPARDRESSARAPSGGPRIGRSPGPR
jgi:hypothetical protein